MIARVCLLNPWQRLLPKQEHPLPARSKLLQQIDFLLWGALQKGSWGDQTQRVCDISADYQVTRSFSTTLYYGHAWGKGVVAAIYPKDANGQYVFLETNCHF